MDIEEFKALCKMTVDLTELRQNECKHLCIENFAPELLAKLIFEYVAATKVNHEGSGYIHDVIKE